MSQNSLVVADGSGAAVLAALNNALNTLASENSGASAPGTTYAYQLWADTANGVIKQRNAANSGWILRAPLAETLVVSRASNTILAVGDFGRAIIATGTWTQTFSAASTLGDGWCIEYRNDGAGVITLDPNASETIDGVTTITLAAGESCCVYCDGTQLKTIGRNPPTVAKTNVVQTFTAAQRGAITALTYAATVAVDLSLSNNFSLAMTGNATLGAPTNMVAGQSGCITITQDATGSRTLAYNTAWKFAGGTVPALSTAANAVDVLSYYVQPGGTIAFASLAKGIA